MWRASGGGFCRAATKQSPRRAGGSVVFKDAPSTHPPRVATEADGIVTGDNDLIALGSFEGIPIIKAAEAL